MSKPPSGRKCEACLGYYLHKRQECDRCGFPVDEPLSDPGRMMVAVLRRIANELQIIRSVGFNRWEK